MEVDSQEDEEDQPEEQPEDNIIEEENDLPEEKSDDLSKEKANSDNQVIGAIDDDESSDGEDEVNTANVLKESFFPRYENNQPQKDAEPFIDDRPVKEADQESEENEV